MSRIVFMLEEYSMKVFLDEAIPRLLAGVGYVCVYHDGKTDLEKSLPRKLKAWREPGVRFIVVRDNDGANCKVVKQRLADLCADASRPDSLIRVACQELEAWYLGDPGALATAFGDENLGSLGAKERFRNPDAVNQPSRRLEELVPSFQKVSGARAMGAAIRRDGNTSRSFEVFLAGVERVAAEMRASATSGEG